jgi:hypothetical protein
LAMSDAVLSKTSIAYLPTFRDAFSWATDRRLHVLYDAIADELSQSFKGLREAGQEQIEVLGRIANMIGLPQAVTQPLPETEDEELAQRIAWRTTARWTVLSLLFTLAEELSDGPRSPEQWAAAVPVSERTELLGKSALPRADERLALGLAAVALHSRFAKEPSVLHIRGRSLLVRAVDGGVTAREVKPVALICTAGEIADGLLPLRSEDRVWPASGETELEVHGERREEEGQWTMASDGALPVGDGRAYAPVVRDVALLFERDAAEDDL